jgi:hypothetical protein
MTRLGIIQLASDIVAILPELERDGAINKATVLETMIRGAENNAEPAQVPAPEGFREGKTVEHILISVTVVHTNKIIQYDDSIAHIVQVGLEGYIGLERVVVRPHYEHGKIEQHVGGCKCGHCDPKQDRQQVPPATTEETKP